MNQLHQYVYEKKHGRKNKKGVLFAKVKEGDLCIGYSSCSPKDFFDRDFGLQVAIERAEKFCVRPPRKVIPYAIQPALVKFTDRCKRYFKTNNIPQWLNGFVTIEDTMKMLRQMSSNDSDPSMLADGC